MISWPLIRYKNPQAAIRNNVNVAVPVTASQGSSQGVTLRLQPMKDFLNDVPTEDRLELLNSLVLKNGHIVSAYIGPLKRTLDKKRVDEILDSIFINRRAKIKMPFDNTGMPSRFTRLSTLLENLPAPVKNEFLDNLTFKDGAFAAAYVGGIRKILKDENFKEMVRSLTTDPRATATTDNPKSLCWDGICEDAGCFSCGNHACCKDSVIESICDTSCK